MDIMGPALPLATQCVGELKPLKGYKDGAMQAAVIGNTLYFALFIASREETEVFWVECREAGYRVGIRNIGGKPVKVAMLNLTRPVAERVMPLDLMIERSAFDPECDWFPDTQGSKSHNLRSAKKDRLWTQMVADASRINSSRQSWIDQVATAWMKHERRV